MSKCGYCGFDGNIGEHMVMKCKARSIPKNLYERAAVWMADNEDSSLLEENMDAKDVDQFLLDEAMDIMYELYQIYNLRDD